MRSLSVQNNAMSAENLLLIPVICTWISQLSQNLYASEAVAASGSFGIFLQAAFLFGLVKMLSIVILSFQSARYLGCRQTGRNVLTDQSRADRHVALIVVLNVVLGSILVATLTAIKAFWPEVPLFGLFTKTHAKIAVLGLTLVALRPLHGRVLLDMSLATTGQDDIAVGTKSNSAANGRFLRLWTIQLLRWVCPAFALHLLMQSRLPENSEWQIVVAAGDALLVVAIGLLAGKAMWNALDEVRLQPT